MAIIVISMLRGVNVGSHKRMKMDALRSVKNRFRRNSGWRSRTLHLFPGRHGTIEALAWLIEKKLKTTGTGRNWNTVTNLLAIAEKLES